LRVRSIFRAHLVGRGVKERDLPLRPEAADRIPGAARFWWTALRVRPIFFATAVSGSTRTVATRESAPATSWAVQHSCGIRQHS
jgi:hypothetical protein